MLNKKDFIKALVDKYQDDLFLTQEQIEDMINRGFIYHIELDGNYEFDAEYYLNPEVFSPRLTEYKNTLDLLTDYELSEKLIEQDSDFASVPVNAYNQMAERGLIDERFFYKVDDGIYLFSPDLAFEQEYLKSAIAELDEQLDKEEQEEFDELDLGLIGEDDDNQKENKQEEKKKEDEEEIIEEEIVEVFSGSNAKKDDIEAANKRREADLKRAKENELLLAEQKKAEAKRIQQEAEEKARAMAREKEALAGQKGNLDSKLNESKFSSDSKENRSSSHDTTKVAGEVIAGAGASVVGASAVVAGAVASSVISGAATNIPHSVEDHSPKTDSFTSENKFNTEKYDSNKPSDKKYTDSSRESEYKPPVAKQKSGSYTEGPVESQKYDSYGESKTTKQFSDAPAVGTSPITEPIKSQPGYNSNTTQESSNSYSPESFKTDKSDYNSGMPYYGQTSEQAYTEPNPQNNSVQYPSTSSESYDSVKETEDARRKAEEYDRIQREKAQRNTKRDIESFNPANSRESTLRNEDGTITFGGTSIGKDVDSYKPSEAPVPEGPNVYVAPENEKHSVSENHSSQTSHNDYNSASQSSYPEYSQPKPQYNSPAPRTINEKNNTDFTSKSTRKTEEFDSSATTPFVEVKTEQPYSSEHKPEEDSTFVNHKVVKDSVSSDFNSNKNHNYQEIKPKEKPEIPFVEYKPKETTFAESESESSISSEYKPETVSHSDDSYKSPVLGNSGENSKSESSRYIHSEQRTEPIGTEPTQSYSSQYDDPYAKPTTNRPADKRESDSKSFISDGSNPINDSQQSASPVFTSDYVSPKDASEVYTENPNSDFNKPATDSSSTQSSIKEPNSYAQTTEYNKDSKFHNESYPENIHYQDKNKTDKIITDNKHQTLSDTSKVEEVVKPKVSVSSVPSVPVENPITESVFDSTTKEPVHTVGQTDPYKKVLTDTEEKRPVEKDKINSPFKPYGPTVKPTDSPIIKTEQPPVYASEIKNITTNTTGIIVSDETEQPVVSEIVDSFVPNYATKDTSGEILTDSQDIPVESLPKVFNVPLPNGSYMTFKENVPEDSATAPVFDPYDNKVTRSQTLAVSEGIVLSGSAIADIITKVKSDSGYSVTITEKTFEGDLATKEVFNSQDESHTISQIFDSYKTAANVTVLPDSTQQAEAEKKVLMSIGVLSEPIKLTNDTWKPAAVPTIHPRVFIDAKEQGAKFVEVNGTRVHIDEMIKVSSKEFSVVSDAEHYTNTAIAKEQISAIKKVESNTYDKNKASPVFADDFTSISRKDLSQIHRDATATVSASADSLNHLQKRYSLDNTSKDTTFVPAFVLSAREAPSSVGIVRERRDSTKFTQNEVTVKRADGVSAIGTLGSFSDLKQHNIPITPGNMPVFRSFAPKLSESAKQEYSKVATSIISTAEDTKVQIDTTSPTSPNYIDFRNAEKVEAIAAQIDATQPEIAANLRAVSYNTNGDIAVVLANQTLLSRQLAENKSNITLYEIDGNQTLSNVSKYIKDRPEYAEIVAASIATTNPEQADKIRRVSRKINGEVAIALENQTISKNINAIKGKEAELIAEQYISNPAMHIEKNARGVEAVAIAVAATSPALANQLRNLSLKFNGEYKQEKGFNYAKAFYREEEKALTATKDLKTDFYGDLTKLVEERKTYKFQSVRADKMLENSNTSIRNKAKFAEIVAAEIERREPKKAALIREKSLELNGEITVIYRNEIISNKIQHLSSDITVDSRSKISNLLKASPEFVKELEKAGIKIEDFSFKNHSDIILNNPALAKLTADLIENEMPNESEIFKNISIEANKISDVNYEAILENPELYIKNKAFEIETIASALDSTNPEIAQRLRVASYEQNGDLAIALNRSENGEILSKDIAPEFGSKMLANPNAYIKGKAEAAELVAIALEKEYPERALEIRKVSRTINGRSAVVAEENTILSSKVISEKINPQTQAFEWQNTRFTSNTNPNVKVLNEKATFVMGSQFGQVKLRHTLHNKHRVVRPEDIKTTGPVLTIVEKDRLGRKYVSIASLDSNGRMNFTWNANSRRNAVSLLGLAPDIKDFENLNITNSVTSKSALFRTFNRGRKIQDAYLVQGDKSMIHLNSDWIASTKSANLKGMRVKTAPDDALGNHLKIFAAQAYSFYGLNKTMTNPKDFAEFQKATRTGKFGGAWYNTGNWHKFQGVWYGGDAGQEHTFYQTYGAGGHKSSFFWFNSRSVADKHIKQLKSERFASFSKPFQQYFRYILPARALGGTYLMVGARSLFGRYAPITLGFGVLANSGQKIEYLKQKQKLLFLTANNKDKLFSVNGITYNLTTRRGRNEALKVLRLDSHSAFGGLDMSLLSNKKIKQILTDGTYRGVALTNDQKDILKNILHVKNFANGNLELADLTGYFAATGIVLSGQYSFKEYRKAMSEVESHLQKNFATILGTQDIGKMSLSELKNILKTESLSDQQKQQLEVYIKVKEGKQKVAQAKPHKLKAFRTLGNVSSRKLLYAIMGSGTMLGGGIGYFYNKYYKVRQTISIIKALRDFKRANAKVMLAKMHNARPGSFYDKLYKRFQGHYDRLEKRINKREARIEKRQVKKQAKRDKKQTRKQNRRDRIKNSKVGRKIRSRTQRISKVGNKIRGVTNKVGKVVGKIVQPFKIIAEKINVLKQKLLSKVLLPLAKYALIAIAIFILTEMALFFVGAGVDAIYGILYPPNKGVTEDGVEYTDLDPSQTLTSDRIELCINLDSTLKYYCDEFYDNNTIIDKVKNGVPEEERKGYYDPATNDTLKLKNVGSKVNGVQTGLYMTYYDGDGNEIGFKSNAKEIVSLANAWIGYSHNCKGLYKSYVEKLWNYSHMVGYLPRKQATGKYVYSCASQEASSECYANEYEYHCNKSSDNVYKKEGGVYKVRTDIKNGKDEDTGKSNYIWPYKSAGCQIHNMTYHRISKTGVNQHANDVSAQVQNLASYSKLVKSLPNGKKTNISFYAQWQSPSNPYLNQDLVAPSGCTNWKSFTFAYKDSNGDVNEVKAFYCAGCAGSCPEKATTNISFTTTKANFHQTPNGTGYFGGYGTMDCTYKFNGWYYDASNKQIYLKNQEEVLDTDMINALKDWVKYAGGYFWATDAQYKSCLSKGCLTVVYCSGHSGNNHYIGTSPGNCTRSTESGGKYYCTGHYVCKGYMTTKSQTISAPYCKGYCPGHKIQHYCTGHVDLDIGVVTLFLDDRNSLGYLGVPKKVTSQIKEVTETNLNVLGQNVDETYERKVQTAVADSDYLYLNSATFARYDYSKYPLPYIKHAWGIAAEVELDLSGYAVIDQGNMGNPLDTIVFLPEFARDGCATMDKAVEKFFTTFSTSEWKDYNDFSPTNNKIYNIAGSYEKFGKYHYFSGYFDYDSSGNLIMHSEVTPDGNTILRPKDSGLFGRAVEAAKEDWFEAYGIEFPGAANEKPSDKEIARLLGLIQDANGGSSAKTNKAKDLLESIGSSFSGDSIDFAHIWFQNIYKAAHGSELSAVKNAYTNACSKSGYRQKAHEFRKLLSVHAISNDNQISNLKVGDILGAGDEAYIVLYNDTKQGPVIGIDVNGNYVYGPDRGIDAGHVIVATVNGNKTSGEDTIHLFSFTTEYISENKDVFWIYKNP